MSVGGFFHRPPEVRRIEWMAIVYTLVGAAVSWFFRGRSEALVLTLLGSLCIVNFRALQLQVSLLEPRSDGRLGMRNSLLIGLRLTFLGALASGALILGPSYLLAMLLGFSVIPAALMTEALLRVTGLFRQQVSSKDF